MLRTVSRVAWTALLGLTLIACSRESPNGDEPPEPPVQSIEPRLAERIQEATEAVRRHPDSAAGWGRLGEIYDVNSFPARALECYARAAAIDPDQFRWPYFAGLLLRSQDPEAARAQLARAASLRPELPALWFHLGFAHFLAEEFDEAQRRFEQALKLDPDCLNAKLGLARVAVARGEPAAALARLEAATVNAAGEGALHLHLAQVYHELGRHADAVSEERLTAESRSPALPDGLAVLADPVRDEVKRREGISSRRMLAEARRYLLEGRSPLAEEALEKALEADPDSVPALVVSARILIQRGELARARPRLEHALALDDDNAEAHVELGMVRILSGQMASAIESLERALELDPSRTRVKTSLAGLYARSGRGQEALELLRDASLDQPDDLGIKLKQARVLVGLGQLRQAAELLQALAGTDPPAGEFRADLVRAFESLASAQTSGEDIDGAAESAQAARQLLERPD